MWLLYKEQVKEQDREQDREQGKELYKEQDKEQGKELYKEQGKEQAIPGGNSLFFVLCVCPVLRGSGCKS